MNEQDLAARIARHLDQATDRLPLSVLYKLRAAREAALERAREPALTHLGGGLLAGADTRRLFGPLAGIALLLLMLFYWHSLQQQSSQISELAELDADVLTDDLPVTAYLDQGFEVWLYHHSKRDSEH